MNESASESSSPITQTAITDSSPLHVHVPGTLQSKNVRIHERRTSVRLEPARQGPASRSPSTGP